MKRWPVSLAPLLVALFLFLPNKALQFIIAFVLAVGVFSWAYSKFLQKKLKASRVVRFLKISCYESIELTILVENCCFLPVQALYIMDSGRGGSGTWESGRWLISLAGHEKMPLRYRVSALKRGEFSLWSNSPSAGDPLGLFPFSVIVEDYCRILVRPARVPLSVLINNGIPQGALTVANKRYEDITLYRSVRDYVPGDELKRINWKSSARFGQLYTNEYQDTLNCPFFVFLDLSTESYPLHLRYSVAETAIETAAALITLAASAHQRCGFASTGSVSLDGWYSFIGAGSRQAESILDLLAKITMTSGNCADSPALIRSLYEAPSGGRIFRVGPEPRVTEDKKGIRYRRISEFIHEVTLHF